MKSDDFHQRPLSNVFMRILIFGITGMLGHVIWLKLKQTHKTFGTIRKTKEELKKFGVFFENDNSRIIDKIDVSNEYTINKALTQAQPDLVINCIGIVKQLPAAHDPEISIRINSLFPHILAKRCYESNIRLIHISTDCVFSGRKGLYNEADPSDAEDLYGRTKYLGEVSGPKVLTIRTSFIGCELTAANGLLEWFLAQKGKQVKGYQKSVFSGFTTYALAEIMQKVIEKHQSLEGLYHISSEPITKYDLLNKLKQKLLLDVEIVPDDSVVVDRSLDSTKFGKATNMTIPSWDKMVDDLATRVVQYDDWRQQDDIRR
jgi:dTDP-4-dehydrorhamnose reductase